MPELSRSLQPRHITMISIGGMIGAGLFVSSSAAIAATGPAIVLSYLITGLLVLLVMRMLGEMAVAHPAVRSFTEFARAGLGNWAGFVAGWLYWYFWMIVVPVEAIAGANILHGWLSVLAGAVTVYFSLTGAEITTIAAAESKEPARAVARMSSSVIVRILTFYVGSVLLIVAVVPWVNIHPGESPFTLALTTMQFKWASLAMSAIILT